MIQPFQGFLSLFSSVDSSVTISPIIILVLTGVIAIGGTILTLILEYHWKAYAVNKMEILRVRFWYYIGIVIFGGGMVVSALLYVFTL